ncbi:MAG: 50S ribosomal protein L10 [Bacteroidota bacterium]
MNRDEKEKMIASLVDTLSTYSSFYIADISSLNSEKTSKLRRMCYNKNVQIKVAKNSLIEKALGRMEGDFEQMLPTLKGSSVIMLAEIPNAAAKVIKEFRKTSDRPILKSAYIDSAIFVGDNQLDSLATLKSREELVGDIIGLLQSPAKNVISALKSSGGKLAGILKTLEERGEKAA